MRTVAAIGAALALLWAGGAGASAPAPPSDERHLLLVPATPAGTAALARTDARTVARYEAFSLVEASADDDRQLRAAGADRRDDMRTVQTAAGAIDPVAERASLAAKGAPDRDEVLALVQFVGPPKDAWLERLRATGARLVTYQAENAYVVHARGDAVERLAALQGSDPAVRAVTALTAADKLQDRTSASGVFAVTTVAGAAGADARAEAGTEDAPIRLGALRSDRLALSPAEVARLAEVPGVVAVEAYAAPELHDERGAQIVAGNLTAPAFTLPAEPPAYGDWLESQGFDDTPFDFAIDVTDTGLDTGANPSAHPDFADRLAYVNDYSDDPDARDCVGHGTNVASIAAGRSASTGAAYEDAQGFDHGLGVAPYARVGASKIFSCTGAPPASFSPGTIAATAYAAGARISNNSWGSDAKGDYTLVSAIYDALVRDSSPTTGGLQPMVEVVSAGNEGEEGHGSTGDLGSAKNVISVGAAESVRASGTDGCGATNAAADSARDVATFSGRGPTDDGRRKPDLVAPGTHIIGAAPQHAGYNAGGVCTKYLAGTTWYSVATGTSQAAPHVSGAAALVRRSYQRTYGGAPSPALTKALLVNTATDLAGGQDGMGDAISAGPSNDQGWGRVNVGNVFDGTQRALRDQVFQERLTATGDRRTGTYSVADTAAPVKVTLAWTDPPGSTTGDPVVNDLDLVVVAGGRTYKGNVFDGAYSRTGGAADPRNNLESVYLPAGTSGRFAVSIVGTGIAGDGVPIDTDVTDQDFALVVSNGAAAQAPVLAHDATTLDDLGDRDGALEPGERFTLAERLGNAGAMGAAGISGTLAGGADLTITQATSGWPAIAPSATGVNATLLAGALASGAACGANVPATLTLTLSGGPQTVPLTLPTGAAGAPVASTRALTPRLAIPDDAAAGATSTIDVPEAGLIKDVDVRIADVDHDWVGDLRIEIVAPDGTAVTLADHLGGPDNGGDDFAGTVFDDEAAASIAVGSAPYTGRFRPQNDQLSRLDGKQQQGTWTLRVRDLARGNAGTVGAWGTDTSPATCSIAAITAIASGPAEGSTVSDRDPEFAFGAESGGASFECRLDGAAFAPCTSPKAYAGLADGPHTFDVGAIVGQTTDPTPASRTWTIDATAPAPTVTAPVDGVTIHGTAGTAAGDADAVTVTVYEGATAMRSMQATRDAAGAWWVDVAPALPPGDYTVRAEQADDSKPANIGQSAAVAFRIAPPPEPPPNPGPPPPPPAPPAEQPSPPAEAPSFLLAPADEAADRLTVLAACASACEVRASLGTLGAGRASLATAGTAAVRVRLNARGRAALRRKAAVRASLRVTLLAGGRTLTLSRPVTIRRKANVGRRLRLWAVCSETCPLSATVRTARRVVAEGRTVAGPGAATRLDVRFARPARRGRAVLEAVAGGEVTRAVTLGVRLR